MDPASGNTHTCARAHTFFFERIGGNTTSLVLSAQLLLCDTSCSLRSPLEGQATMILGSVLSAALLEDLVHVLFAEFLVLVHEEELLLLG